MKNVLSLIVTVVSFLSSLAAGQFFGFSLPLSCGIAALFAVATGVIFRFAIGRFPGGGINPRHATMLSLLLAIYMALDGVWMAFFSTSEWSAPLGAAAFFVALLNCCIAIAYRMNGGAAG
jgi:hypothetical protein